MLEAQRKGVEDLERLYGRGYEYQLQNYTSNLSELTFVARRIEPSGSFYRITFQTTHYVQTMVSWDQGDFRLATADRFLALADALNLSTIQREQLLLFVAVPLNRPEVMILCHRVFLSQEMPFP